MPVTSERRAWPAERKLDRKQKVNQIKPGLPQDFEMESNRVPLYKRLPTHDKYGKPLSDFMMLIPGLKNQSAPHLNSRLAIMHAVLGAHQDVVFADLNAPLNLLWVSVKARHGVINELVAEIRLRIPEARLLGHPAFGNLTENRGQRVIESNS